MFLSETTLVENVYIKCLGDDFQLKIEEEIKNQKLRFLKATFIHSHNSNCGLA